MGPLPDSSRPSNSEASERTLQVLAASPAAVNILEKAFHEDSTSDVNTWRTPIPYDNFQSEFRLSDLVRCLHLYSTHYCFSDSDDFLLFCCYHVYLAC